MYRICNPTATILGPVKLVFFRTFAKIAHTIKPWNPDFTDFKAWLGFIIFNGSSPDKLIIL